MGKKKTKRHTEPAKPAARPFSGKNGRLLLGAALLVCILPTLLGIRLWPDLPDVVPSGFTGPDGKDDSFPKAVIVFGFPVLMCILDLIAYCQLLFLNKKAAAPSAALRLAGRWGFPAMSAVFCSGMILQASGSGITIAFLAPCLLGLLLMLLGSFILDVPDGVHPIPGGPSAAFSSTAGKLWLAAGFLITAGTMLFTGSL